MLVSGRVWGVDTREPLASARLDIWQADSKGRYDNDDPRNPPKPDVFLNRCASSPTKPVPTNSRRSIPVRTRSARMPGVRATFITWSRPGYRPLVTQLFFKGDPHNKTDDFIKDSLIIELVSRKIGDSPLEVGTFDIVLVPTK